MTDSTQNGEVASKTNVVTFAVAIYCVLSAGLIASCVIAFMDIPGCLWLALPYVCLLLLERVFHKNRFERVIVFVFALFVASYGVLALLDGLVLHEGFLVSTDIRISHLVTLFLPINQMQYCFLFAAFMLLSRLLAHMCKETF